MTFFRTPTSTGVAETFVAMGLIYFCFMMFGALMVRRLPAPGWRPASSTSGAGRLAQAHRDMTADEAIKTPQFWLLWAILFVNVSAGIGELVQASPMIQEMFADRVSATAAAGFVGLLSLFNMGGRFCWSSLSDTIGRSNTYTVFFLLGSILYGLTPLTGRFGMVVIFVVSYGIIMSMYGGGFATIPAYLCADLFAHCSGGGYSRPSADGLVCRRGRGAGTGQLPPRLSDQARRAQGRGLHGNDVHHGRAARWRVRVQPAGAPRWQQRRTCMIENVKPEGACAGRKRQQTASGCQLATWVGVPLAWGVLQTLRTSLAAISLDGPSRRRRGRQPGRGSRASIAPSRR